MHTFVPEQLQASFWLEDSSSALVLGSKVAQRRAGGEQSLSFNFTYAVICRSSYSSAPRTRWDPITVSTGYLLSWFCKCLGSQKESRIYIQSLSCTDWSFIIMIAYLYNLIIFCMRNLTVQKLVSSALGKQVEKRNIFSNQLSFQSSWISFVTITDKMRTDSLISCLK